MTKNNLVQNIQNEIEQRQYILTQYNHFIEQVNQTQLAAIKLLNEQNQQFSKQTLIEDPDVKWEKFEQSSSIITTRYDDVHQLGTKLMTEHYKYRNICRLISSTIDMGEKNQKSFESSLYNMNV
ncbi:unnamed protein product, partial [Didymodactylos carnosus]